MQPEAFTAGFIATHYRRSFGEAKALFGLRDCLEQARLVTGCDTPFARLLTVARGATKLPGLFTQCKRHKQHALRCGIMAVVGRCRHGLSPPWETSFMLYGFWKRSVPTAARLWNQPASIVSILPMHRIPGELPGDRMGFRKA